MEYERIHKPQTGLISPSKLRMKLIGAHNQMKKQGSNSNSSRTSPARLEDSEFVKNSLLATQSGDFGEEITGEGGKRAFRQHHFGCNVLVCNAEVSLAKLSENTEAVEQGDSMRCPQRESIPRENGDTNLNRVQQQVLNGEGPNSNLVYPVRTFEDENLDYDSTSSFEFHRGERSHHHPIARSFSRPMPSKWNDAEKWIMNRQSMPPGNSKKVHFQNPSNRGLGTNVVRVAPELSNHENKLSVKRVDFCQSATHLGTEKFAFVPSGSHSVSVQRNGRNPLIDPCPPEAMDLREVDNDSMSSLKSSIENTTGLPPIRSVSMRDTGTEMTPIPSQEPSRTATPVSSTSPLRSPTSSIPSSPRRGEPAPTPVENLPGNSREPVKIEMSEEELKQKTRREIVALGVQLGKMNIAAWASKDVKDKSISIEADCTNEIEQIEFAKRAAAWEEAERSKHNARFKREEIKIQAWECQQKAKLEAEMRKTEAKAEQIRAQAQAKMIKKIAMAKQRSEEQKTAAEARRNRQAEKVAAQAESIRKTGRLPSSSSSAAAFMICCGW